MIGALRRAAARMEALKNLNLDDRSTEIGAAFDSPVQVALHPARAGFTVTPAASGNWKLDFLIKLGNVPLPRTIITLNGDWNAALTISPERGWLVKIAKLLWLKDTPTGDRTFDRQVILRTADGDGARAFLSVERREMILEILRLAAPDHTHLQVRPDRITLENHGILLPEHVAVYEKFISLFSGK